MRCSFDHVDLFRVSGILLAFACLPICSVGDRVSCGERANFARVGPFVGWYLDPSASWRPVSARLAGTTVFSATDSVGFLARGGPASWTLTVEPIWIDPFHLCRFSYRAGGLRDQAERVISVRSGATGPVTPGGKNPENPLALRGEATLLSGEEVVPDMEWHDVTMDLAPLLDTHQIDQIVVEMRPRDNASLELKQLRFETSTLERLPSQPPSQDTSLRETCSEWEPIPMPEGSAEWNDLKDLFDRPSRAELAAHRIPFRLPGADALIPATVLWDEGHLKVPLHGHACEIGVLMGCRLFGTDGTWRFKQRTEIRQPERLMATLHYEDGSTFHAFPWETASSDFRVLAGINTYLIPADPRKKLSYITIDEWMSYGRVFLLSVALHRSGDRISPELPAAPVKRIRGTRTHPERDPEIAVTTDESITISDGLLEMELPSTGEFRLLDLRHLPLARSLVRNATDRRLFTLCGYNRDISSASFSVVDFLISTDRRSLTLSCRSEEIPLRVEVSFSVHTNHGIAFDLAIRNAGDARHDMRVASPDLRGLRLSSRPGDDFYCFPIQAAVISSRPADLAADYGGRFPLQFVDLFARGGGGLYLLTQDRVVREKRYGVRKSDNGTGIRVEYGRYVPIQLNPGKTWTAPRTIFGGHMGDWHEALAAYRSWSQSWKKSRAACRAWVSDIWICRRDYPLGGTGYLFDEGKNRYTFAKLIRESEEELGGIDLIDISGWAYSKTRGRVGDYDCSELGGAHNLRGQISLAHEQGVRTGLYLEGYLVDERSRVIETVGDRWQIVGTDGEKRFWPGNREMFMCPAVIEWQEYFSRTYRRVAEETGADALYVDEFGFADRRKACYSDQHGHPTGQSPLVGEDAMLRRIRAALDTSRPEVAVYTEEVPCDLTSQLVDAAFCYGMYHASPGCQPTKINLFRYAFPQLKIIELFVPGIHPRASSEEDAKLAFFHGHALWLKGRAASWYSGSFREFVRKSQKIRRLYSQVFASAECEPLVPTLVTGVYANRFSQGPVTIYTLYNSLFYCVDAPLIAIPIAQDQPVIDLWRGGPAEVETHQGRALVRSALPPHGIGCVAVLAE